jgi:hypothetical protein
MKYPRPDPMILVASQTEMIVTHIAECFFNLYYPRQRILTPLVLRDCRPNFKLRVTAIPVTGRGGP